MRFDTFQNLFNFRQYCLCHNELDVVFDFVPLHTIRYSLIVQNTKLQIINNCVVIPITLTLHENKNDINFQIIIPINERRFSIIYENKNNVQQDIEQINKYFSLSNQFLLSLKLVSKCATNQCDYASKTSVIFFTLIGNYLSPLNLINEKFSLVNSIDSSIVIENHYNRNSTTIKYRLPSTQHILGSDKYLLIENESFFMIPLERELLLHKVNQLLLFL